MQTTEPMQTIGPITTDAYEFTSPEALASLEACAPPTAGMAESGAGKAGDAIYRPPALVVGGRPSQITHAWPARITASPEPFAWQAP